MHLAWSLHAACCGCRAEGTNKQQAHGFNVTRCLVLLQAVAAELEGESQQDADDDMEEDGSEGGPLTSRDIAIQATLKLGAGIALCAVFSDPLVEALTNLSR